MNDIDKNDATRPIKKPSLIRRFISLFFLNNPIGHMDLEKVYPTQDELNADPELNRSYAADMAEDQRATIASIRESTVSISKWILTTLLAINSGGLVGLSQLAIAGQAKVCAAMFFIAGILITLFSAHLSVRAGLAMSLPAGEAQGYWRTVRHLGYRDRDMELAQAGAANIALQASKWPYRLGYSSIACFVVGLACVGYGLLTAAQ